MPSRKKSNKPRKSAKKKTTRKKAVAKKSARRPKPRKKALPKSKGPAMEGPPPAAPGEPPRGTDQLCTCIKKGSRWFCMKRDDDGKLVVCDGPFPTKKDCEENAICEE